MIDDKISQVEKKSRARSEFQQVASRTNRGSRFISEQVVQAVEPRQLHVLFRFVASLATKERVVDPRKVSRQTYGC